MNRVAIDVSAAYVCLYQIENYSSADLAFGLLRLLHTVDPLCYTPAFQNSTLKIFAGRTTPSGSGRFSPPSEVK